MNTTRIAVAAGKGGVGKTTISCGISSVLAHKGYKTLVVDLDPQSNAAWGLGADPASPGAAELLMGQKTTFQEVSRNLWVLAGGPLLKNQDIVRMDAESLLDAIRPLDYQAIVFDCPPSLDYLERLGLVASTFAWVVLDAHPFAIQGASRVIADLESRKEKGREGATHCGLITSRIDARRSLDRDVKEAVSLSFPGIPIVSVCQDAKLSMASTERQPIMNYSPTARGAEDLQSVIETQFEYLSWQKE
ncbi:MAG: AAA family ATPase [Desulfamplus sp.]|nr:AAA family ATPase [Desulfamplus sp.]